MPGRRQAKQRASQRLSQLTHGKRNRKHASLESAGSEDSDEERIDGGQELDNNDDLYSVTGSEESLTEASNASLSSSLLRPKSKARRSSKKAQSTAVRKQKKSSGSDRSKGLDGKNEANEEETKALTLLGRLNCDLGKLTRAENIKRKSSLVMLVRQWTESYREAKRSATVDLVNFILEVLFLSHSGIKLQQASGMSPHVREHDFETVEIEELMETFLEDSFLEVC